MNRSSKWYQNTRPRRQCYQLLRDDEDAENDDKFDTNIESNIKLSSIRPELYVEKILEPGDTLQTLSLQFNCPVAELKRINHILRDNEIFARRKIKVPVKPGSVITEKLARVHSTNGVKSECANVTSCTDEENDNLADPKLDFTSQLLQDSLHVNSFSTSNEIKNNKSGSHTSFNSVSTETTLLQIENTSGSLQQNNEQQHRLHSSTENQLFKCSGADWGLSWLQLVVCMLLLGFGGPLFFYILYMTEKKHPS